MNHKLKTMIVGILAVILLAIFIFGLGALILGNGCSGGMCTVYNLTDYILAGMFGMFGLIMILILASMLGYLIVGDEK